MSAIRNVPVTDASAWNGVDLQQRNDWQIELGSADCAEIIDYLDRVSNTSLRSVEDFQAVRGLSGINDVIDRLANELKRGRGFALLKGCPIDGYSEGKIQHLFWAISKRLGEPLTQNGDRELLGHVFDKGATGGSLNARGFASRGGGGFHVDLTDVVGLMCIRQAMQGGESKLISSMTIYNTLLIERPDLLPVLFRGYIWDRRAEQLPNEDPCTARIPVFSEADGQLSCRMHQGFIGWWVRRSEQDLSDEEQEALEVFHEIAERPGLGLTFTLDPGDILFVNNYTVMHARTSFEDWPDSHRKRYLLRIWLDMPGIRSFLNEEIVRYGVVRHGYLGLTADRLQQLEPRTATQ